MRRLMVGLAALLVAAAALAQVPGSATGSGGQTSGASLAPRSVSCSTLVMTTLCAKDYGAKCDNSTDDTTALNNFFAALAASPQLAGQFPPGVCRFSSLLTFPVNYTGLSGAGRYSTILYYTGASTTTDLVDVFGTSISSLKGPAVYTGFSIQSGTVMTAGAAMHIKWVQHVTFNDFATGTQSDATHNLFNGSKVEAAGEIYFNGFESSYNLGEGFQVSGGGVAAPPQYDVNVKGCLIQGNAGTGIHIGGGWDGANFDDCTDVGNQTNVVVDHALSSFGNQEILFGPRFYNNAPTGNATNVGDNYLINDSLASAANLCNITIAGPITLSPHENGINVESWPSCAVNVVSTMITNHAKSGIYVQDTTANVTVSGATNILSNARYGIEASAANTKIVSSATISGNTLGSYLNVNTFLNLIAGGYTVQSLSGNSGAPFVNTSPLISIGSQFTATSSCGGTITIAANTFGPAAGYFTVPTGGTGCQFTMTIGGANPVTAPHGWFCWGEDFTSKLLAPQYTQSTTTCTLQVTAATNDIITWGVVSGY